MQMTSTTMKSVISCLFLMLLQTACTSAQRPPYAGPRPTGGLNQKDKYHTGTLQPTANGVANRFGETNESVNAIPFGTAQRPPVGLPVVVPQSQYIPLNVNRPGTPQFTLDNRISGNDIGGNAGGFASGPPQFQPIAPLPVVAGVLPLDAHGDQGLIDYLNTVPVDQRPFWFLNYQAIEAQRNKTNPTSSGAVASRGSFFGK